MTQIQNKSRTSRWNSRFQPGPRFDSKLLFCQQHNKEQRELHGGICGKASDGAHIENCYVYNIDLITTKGLFAGIAANSFFIHNYYDNAKITFIGKNDDGNQLSKNAQYTGTFMNKEDIPIYRLLNQWIDETAPTLYPGYPFTRWTDGGENLPAVFISEFLKK